MPRQTRDFAYELMEKNRIVAKQYQFYSLIMAAMLQADTYNLEKLAQAFPDVFQALNERMSVVGAR